ncbi:hypothetical protein K2P47_05125 [Patescibacteria group bacterium]|nr:hypothetical protein [Patescibacteria group bacterium]
MADHQAATASKENWFVAVKILLRKGNELLVLRDTFGEGDIPGGRLRKDDFETPLLEVLKRKVTEDIGSDVSYKIIHQNPVCTFRHERFEVGSGENVRIFALGFEAEYESGEIITGEYIESHTWIDLRTAQLSDYLEGGWLKGVEEYVQKLSL